MEEHIKHSQLQYKCNRRRNKDFLNFNIRVMEENIKFTSKQ